MLYLGRLLKMTGVIDHLFLKIGRGQPMRAVPDAVAEADRGLVGDLAYGSRKRQVLLIDSETLAKFGLSPGDVRENLTSRGFDLSKLRPGAELRAGEVLLEVTGDCAPCDQLEALQTGLRQAIDGRRGVLARVVSGGRLRVGDPIRIEAGEPDLAAAPDPASPILQQ